MGYSARRGFTNGKSFRSTARQAELQQKIAAMQEQMTAAQNAVEAQEFTASAGGGAVEAKVNGKKEVLSAAHQAGGGRSRGCGDAAGSGGFRRQ